MNRFFGSQSLQLDEKNRLRIPAKFKLKLNDGYYIIHGGNGCLSLMPTERFEQFIAPLASIPFSDVKARQAASRILATVVQPDEDSQGRFILPAKAKQYAGIDKKVVFLGAYDHIEIWSAERYEADTADDTSDGLDQTLGELQRYGF